MYILKIHFNFIFPLLIFIIQKITKKWMVAKWICDTTWGDACLVMCACKSVCVCRNMCACGKLSCHCWFSSSTLFCFFWILMNIFSCYMTFFLMLISFHFLRFCWLMAQVWLGAKMPRQSVLDFFSKVLQFSFLFTQMHMFA